MTHHNKQKINRPSTQRNGQKKFLRPERPLTSPSHGTVRLYFDDNYVFIANNDVVSYFMSKIKMDQIHFVKRIYRPAETCMETSVFLFCLDRLQARLPRKPGEPGKFREILKWSGKN